MNNCIPKMLFDDGGIMPKHFTVMIMLKCTLIGAMMGALIVGWLVEQSA